MNPYDISKPAEGEMFVGRSDVLEEIIDRGLKDSGMPSIVVAGRRLGKTSLLFKIIEQLHRSPKASDGTWIIPVYLDLKEIEQLTTDKFWGKLIDKTVQTLLGDIPDLNLKNVEANISQSFDFDGFKSHLNSLIDTITSQLGKVRIVFLIDEMEEMLGQEWTDGALRNLRSLHNTSLMRGSLSFVLTGFKDLHTYKEKMGSPLANIALTQPLSVLSHEESIELMTKPLEAPPIRIIQDEIYRQSGGHPFLIQYLMWRICHNNPAAATKGDVEEAIDIFHHQRDDFPHWWESLSKVEGEVYALLARGEHGMLKEDICAKLGIEKKEAGDVLNFLCYLGIAKQPERNHFCVSSLMFRDWAQNEGLLEHDKSPTNYTGGNRMITWLHLSDLHIKVSDEYNRKIVLQKLIDDIKEQITQKQLQPDFALITGDVAFASAPDEYSMARQFLDDLIEATNLSKEHLFVIPGNHDINRKTITRGAASVVNDLNARDAVNECLDSEEDKALVFRKFQHYKDFINDYFEGHISFNDEQYFYVKPLELSDKRIAILGLNSAWAAGSHKEADGEVNDENYLLVGERQVREALEKTKDVDIRIAALHHPFDWLKEFDANDVEPLLKQDCDFILHGHLHRTGILQPIDPDSQTMVIAAGTCYESRDYPNMYNFVRLNFKTGEGTIYLRRYSDARGGFWTKDVMTYRNVSDGEYSFDLPAKSQATPADENSSEAFVNQSFNLDEIKTLCFDLGVDYDDIPGKAKEGKIRELISYFGRRQELDRLLAKLQELRPRIFENITLDFLEDSAGAREAEATPRIEDIQQILQSQRQIPISSDVLEESSALSFSGSGAMLSPQIPSELLRRLVIEKDVEISQLQGVLCRDAEEKLRQITQLLDYGDYPKAKQGIDNFFNRLIGDYSVLPQDIKSQAFRIAANVYCTARKLDQAENFVKQALTLAPENPHAIVTQAKILSLQGNKTQALNLLSPINLVESFNMQFAIHFYDDDMKECESLIQQQMPDSPNATTHYLLAQYYRITGDYERSDHHVQKALDITRSYQHLQLAGLIAFNRALHRFSSPLWISTQFLERIAVVSLNDEEKADLDKAESYFSEASQLAKDMLPADDPVVLEIDVQLLACLEWKDEKSALEFAHNILERCPYQLDVLSYLYFVGHIAEIPDLNERLNHIEPTHPLEIFLFAILLVHAERPQEALAVLEQHRNQCQNDNHRFVWYQLNAQIHRSMGDIQVAKQLIEEFDPPSEEPLQKDILLVNHYIDLKDYLSARPLAIKIYEQEKTLESLYVAYTVLRGLKEYSACVDYAQKLVEQIKIGETYWYLAEAQYYQRDYPSAIRTVEEAQKRGLIHRSFDELVGYSYLNLNNFQFAADALEKAYQSARHAKRDCSEVMHNLAICYFNMIGQQERGVSLLRELTESESARPADFLMLSQYYQGQGEHEKAFDVISNAKERFPHNEGIIANYIIIAFQSNHEREGSEALATFQQAFSDSRMIKRTHYEEAKEVILSQMERENFAREKYREGIFPRAFLSEVTRVPFALETFGNIQFNEEQDTYPKVPIYVVSGYPDDVAEWLHKNKPNQIVVEYTALLTLFRLGVLPEVEEAFDKVYLANMLPQNLLYEGYRISSYQRGRYQRQKAIQQAIFQRKIQVDESLKKDNGIEELDEKYGAKQISYDIARAFQLADRLEAYCFCEHLLHAEEAPEFVTARRIGIGDVLNFLTPRYISNTQKEEVLRYFPDTPLHDDYLDRLSGDAVLVADVFSLESLATFDVLNPFLTAFENRIVITSWGADRLGKEMYAVELRQQVVDELSKLGQELENRRDTFLLMPLQFDEQLIKLGREDAVSDTSQIYIRLLADGYNLSIKYQAPLLVDDRAARRLQLEELNIPRCGTFDLLQYLRDKGHLSLETYRQKYLKLLEWNYLFIPLDANVALEALIESANSDSETKDARVLRQYYSACFVDAGLSTALSGANFDCEALRFYMHHNRQVSQLLFNIWKDNRLNELKKRVLSQRVQFHLWKSPDFMKRRFPEHNAIPQCDALQKLHLLLGAVNNLDEETDKAFAEWFYTDWLQKDWAADAPLKESFFDLIYNDLMQQEGPNVFLGAIMIYEKAFPDGLWGEAVEYEPITSLLQERGVQITKDVILPFGRVNVEQFQSWYFDAVERSWFLQQKTAAQVAFEDKELEISLLEIERALLIIGLRISHQGQDVNIPCDIRELLFHPNRQIRQMVCERLKPALSIDTNKLMDEHLDALLAEAEGQWRPAAQQIHKVAQNDLTYFFETLFQKLTARIDILYDDVFPASPSLFEQYCGLQDQDFADSESFSAKFAENVATRFHNIVVDGSLNEEAFADFVRRFFVYPFEDNPAVQQITGFIERDPAEAHHLIDLLTSMAAASYNPILIQNTLDVLLNIYGLNPSEYGADLQNHIIELTTMLLDWNNSEMLKKSRIFETYTLLLSLAYNRMIAPPDYKTTSPSARYFFSYTYAAGVVEVIGKHFTSTPAHLESFENYLKQIIEQDQRLQLFVPRVEAFHDVLFPDRANVVRIVMLGAVQILSRRAQAVVTMKDGVMKDLLFNTYVSVFQGRVRGTSEILRPYQKVTNFFSSYLNRNFCEALGGLLETLYGNSIEQLSEEHQNQYNILTSFSCEATAREIIEALESNMDENTFVYLNYLASYFSEPFSPDWYDEIQKIQPILELPREIEDSMVIYTIFQLNAFFYLNCPADTLGEQFKKNLFEYRRWFYEDVELTSLQLAHVTTVCMEQGNLQELAEWINGLLNRVTSREVLNDLHGALRLIVDSLPLEQRAAFSGLLDNIRARI